MRRLAALLVILLVSTGFAGVRMSGGLLPGGPPPPPPTPVSITFSPASPVLSDGFIGGAQVTTILVNMSDGSTFAGSLGFSPPISTSCAQNGNANGLFSTTLSPSTIVTARNGTPADDGMHPTTVTATQNGVTKCAAVTVSIVPGGNVACDFGPNFTGSVPVPAQTAGFTTCALNADFSSSSFSNTATWLNECGATTPWRFYIQGTFGGSLPCNKITITTDVAGGAPGNVVHYQYLQGDLAATGFNYFQFSWPGAWLTTTGFPPYLPDEMYAEITFRVTPQTLSSFSSWAGGGPLDFFPSTTRSPCPTNCPASWLEEDWFESNGTNTSPPFNWGGGVIDWPNGTAQFGSVTTGSTDITQYHTLRVLQTSDESTAISKCTWVDSTAFGCFSDSPQSVPGATAQTAADEYHQINNMIALWLGSNGNAITNNLDMYIEKIQLWECAGYKTTRCPGTIITTQ